MHGCCSNLRIKFVYESGQNLGLIEKQFCHGKDRNRVLDGNFFRMKIKPIYHIKVQHIRPTIFLQLQ